MNHINMQTLMRKLGLGVRNSAKRVPQNRRGWGSETEELENRALLSAANCDMSDPPVTAHVARVTHKAAVQFPAIAGNWTFQVNGETFSGPGTADIAQTGRKTLSDIHIEGLADFTSKGRFKRHTPATLTFRMPPLEIPGFPIKVRLTVSLNFPANDLNPTTFTGAVKAPFVGTVATITNGAKVPSP